MLYQVDKFLLDTETLTLSIDNQPYDADIRMLKLLTLLFQSYPEPCEQQYLLDNIWDNTVVSYWSLARLVSDTRKFFKEQGYHRPLIQTLYGKGFRLSADVVAQQPASVPAIAPAVPEAVFSAKNRQKRWLTTLTLGLVATMSVVASISALNHQPLQPVSATRLLIGEPEQVAGRILWVDDHPQNNQQELQFMQQHNLAVYQATTTEDALMLLSMYQYDVVISDMGRQDQPLAGLKLLESMRLSNNNTPFFFYTILLSENKQALLEQHGAQGAAETSEALYLLLWPVFFPDTTVAVAPAS